MAAATPSGSIAGALEITNWFNGLVSGVVHKTIDGILPFKLLTKMKAIQLAAW